MAGIEEMVGLFINTLPLRTRSGPHERAVDSIKRMERELQLRQNYEHSSLVNIRQWSETGKGQELFDTLVILENYPLENRLMIERKGLSVKTFTMYEMTHYDLTVSISIFGEIEVKAVYPGDLFADESIERLVTQFAGIVEALIKDPWQLTAGIEIISNEEKKRILYDFNDTLAEYPADKTIHQLFVEQVERTPDHMALAGSKLQNTNYKQIGALRADVDAFGVMHLTYRELNNQSSQLAYILNEKGVKPDTIVGIMVVRSIKMIIGILGILKAGGAYLPIDPAYPEERKKYMLKDSNAEILLTSQDIPGLFSPQALYLSEGHNFTNDQCPMTNDQLAYVIYTSGSTGKPKGVMIEHGAVHNFMAGMARLIDFSPGKIILALTTITFDIFVLETLQPLCRGLKIVLADESHQREMDLLEQLLVRNCVDMVQATPSRMQMFAMTGRGRSSLGNLQELMVGGEALPVQLLAELKQSTSAKIYNMYGPTETTIWSTVKELTAAEEVNIGAPVQNTLIYILDEYNHIQPAGIPGEMCIGGDGLARGYLNRPQLTAEKFVEAQKVPGKNQMHPSRSTTPPLHRSPIYRTGDFARWLFHGEIQFLGRIDQQVKIRGFRVELQEIETLLLKHKGIKEAVVVMKDENSLDQSLCAYLLPDTTAVDAPLTPGEIREMLAHQLPAYMIPAYFVILEQMPLTPNGKLDRKYLTRWGPSYSLAGTTVTFVEPATHLEKTIADIWKEILQIEEVGIHDNFFDLGGNSMKVIQLGRELKDAFGIEIPVALMFRNLTVDFISKHLAPKKIERGKEVKKAEALDRARSTFKDTISKLIKE